MVDTYRLKLGHYEKCAELRKAVNAAHEKANIDEHMLVYNVGLGAPTGTVMVFQPLKSLKEFDDFAKTHGKGSAYYEVVGDAGRKMFTEFAREDEQFSVRDFLAFSPRMSFLSEKVVAARTQAKGRDGEGSGSQTCGHERTRQDGKEISLLASLCPAGVAGHFHL
jgi:hypothetical protein